jgi:hypothetical protein
MVDHQPERIRYARATQDITAGTIAVDARRTSASSACASYDLTALSAAGETWLAAFDAAYETEIGILGHRHHYCGPTAERSVTTQESNCFPEGTPVAEIRRSTSPF